MMQHVARGVLQFMPVHVYVLQKNLLAVAKQPKQIAGCGMGVGDHSVGQ